VTGPHRDSSTTGIPAVGERIAGKYVVERVLGAGGMGVVLAARHEALGSRVAIKLIRGEVAADPSAVGRFLREARASAALESEHVTKVFDTGTLESGGPYMIMEFLAGVDLAEVLKRNGPMALGEALGTLLQACEAIAEAHVKGIVHRDLKPSNLFVARRANGAPLIKVLDFGISKVVDFHAGAASGALTGSGSILGSPHYMSPEQVRSTKTGDARMDIWSLGVILYELLAGVTPFAGDTLGDTFARILADTPPPLRARRPDVPEGLALVIAQCLERDVSRRIASVGDLAVKLAPYAPPEATPSIDAILLLQSPASGATMSATAFANTAPAGASGPHPSYGSGRGPPSYGSGRQDSGGPRIETRPAWQRTSSGDTVSRRGGGRGLALVALGLVLAAATAGTYLLLGHSQGSGPSNTSSANLSPSGPAMPVPPPAVPAMPMLAPLDSAMPAAPTPTAARPAPGDAPPVAAPSMPAASGRVSPGHAREVVPPKPPAKPPVAKPSAAAPASPSPVPTDKDIF
jgi:serine/threonine protein kinase